jgi:asparaginyl-tRNA synthetase
MERTEIASLYQHTPADGTELTVCGWAKNIRDSKNIGFVALADGGCFKTLQVVLQADQLANYDEVVHAGIYTSMRVEGRLVLTPEARQPFELAAARVEILGACPSDEYPLQKKKMSMEYLRTMPTLRPRTNTFGTAFRVRSVAAYAIHRFFQENGFVYSHSPIFTASDCEGAGEMFQVTTLDLANVPKTADGKVDYSEDFFGKPVSLTVSGQLEAEAMAMAFGKVYTFGPTFRAEKSFTTRHAAEFWMIEPEMAFCDLAGYMDTAEAMTKYVIRYVLEHCPDEMAFFNQFIDKGLVERLELVASSDFARISYTDAVEILKKHNDKFQFPVEWGVDIQTEHERYLTEVVYQTPVFVTDYPKEIKSFYMKQNPDGKTVAAADMLVPGIGELIGGSQREDSYDKLVARMDELGMDKSGYQWYLDLRRFGGVEHAGFGLGFERLIMYITGIQNIRDVLPFPRTAYGF